MDVFSALETKVNRLIKAHKELQTRVSALEEENKALQANAAAGEGALKQRVTHLEHEREHLRERLAKLLATVESIEL